MSNDWIHTRRGVALVEGTLPKLARGIEALTAELKRYNDRAEEERSPIVLGGLEPASPEVVEAAMQVVGLRDDEPEPECSEDCAVHDPDCDGHCDHDADAHTNACRVMNWQAEDTRR